MKPTRIATIGFYWVCTCAFIFYIWIEGQARGASPAWLLYWCITSAALAVIPRLPLVGVCIYVLLAYGMSSHAPELDIMLAMRLLDVAALFILTGWLLSGPQLKPKLQANKYIIICGTLLLAWLVICLSAAMMRGIPYGSFLRHDPSGFFQAAVLLMVTFDVVRTRRDCTKLAMLVCATILGRAAIQGVAGIYLESYAATLLVIGIPIALLGGNSTRHPIGRIFFYTAGAAMLVLLALTQNRAAAVAAAFTVAVALWQFQRSTSGLWLGAFVIVAGIALVLIPNNFVDRFGVLLDSALNSASASLAKSTAEERLQLWTAGLEMATQQPMLGVGPGNYPGTLGIYLPGKGLISAHSNYVQMLAETGFPGFLLYLSLFFSIVFMLDGLRRNGVSLWQRRSAQMLELALIAYLIGGIFNSRHDFVFAYVIAGWALALRELTSNDFEMAPSRPPAAI